MSTFLRDLTVQIMPLMPSTLRLVTAYVAIPPKGVTSRPDLTFLEKPFEMDTLLTLILQILEEN